LRQSIRRNAVLDGYRYAVSVAFDHSFTPETSARIAVRGAALDAAVLPESLRQIGGDALMAHIFDFGTVFAQAGYTGIWGRAPLALFGKTRKDDRIDLSAGIIANALEYRGFVPLLRFIYTNSKSNLALYDFGRARLELGLSREF
jgi:hypothetical protein